MNYRFFFVFTLLMLHGCSSSKEVHSTFSDQIVIDGKHDEWGSQLKYDEDQKIAFGFVNNNDYLYLALVTADRNSSRKILMNGLTIWLESSDGKIGIRYPLRMDPEEIRELRMQETNNQNRDPSRIMNMLKGREDLQVINDKDLPLYTNPAYSGDSFRGKIGFENEQLVYELQIPLKGNDVTSRVFKENLSEIDVDIQTGEVNRDGKKGRMGEVGMGEGGQGGGGNREGTTRPPMGEMDISPLDYSFTVILKR